MRFGVLLIVASFAIINSIIAISDEFESRYNDYHFDPQYPTSESNAQAKILANRYLSNNEWYAPGKVYGLIDQNGKVFSVFSAVIRKEKTSDYSRQQLLALINKTKFDLVRAWYEISIFSDSTRQEIYNSTENKENPYWREKQFTPLMPTVDQSIYGCFNNPVIFQEKLFIDKPFVYGIMSTNEVYYAEFIAEPYVANLTLINNVGTVLLTENIFLNNARRCVTPAQPENDIKETSACPGDFEYFYRPAVPSNVRENGKINMSYDFSKISQPFHILFKNIYEPDNIGRVKFAKIYIMDFNSNGLLDILVWHRQFVSAKRKDINPGALRFEKEWFTLYEEVLNKNTVRKVDIKNENAIEWMNQKNLTWQTGWPYDYRQCDKMALKRFGKNTHYPLEMGGGTEVTLYY